MLIYVRRIVALAQSTVANPVLASAAGRCLTWSLASMVAAVAAGIFVYKLLSRGHQKRMAGLAGLLAISGEDQGDLSRDLSPGDDAQSAQVAESFNRFRQMVREMIEKMRHFGISIAVDTTKVNKNILLTSQKTRDQKQLLDMVTAASHEANQAISEVSESAQYVAGQTSQNLEQAGTSSEELAKVNEKIEQINATVGSVREVVEE
jgi:methyl-accepting chemotaxis protein